MINATILSYDPAAPPNSMIDPRQFNHITYGMVWLPIFTQLKSRINISLNLTFSYTLVST